MSAQREVASFPGHRELLKIGEQETDVTRQDLGPTE